MCSHHQGHVVALNRGAAEGLDFGHHRVDDVTGLPLWFFHSSRRLNVHLPRTEKAKHKAIEVKVG